MRILLLTNGLGFGGAERIVEALAEDLRELGDDVRVAATTRGGPIADALRARGHPVDVLGLRSPLDGRIVLRLARLAVRHRIDVIHSHLAVSDIASAAARWFAPRAIRAVSTVHNPGVELSPAKRTLWGPALRRAHQVIAVSKAAEVKLPSGVRARVIHPSLIDPERPLPSRREARARLGLDQEGPLILAIGRLAPVKGHDVLAEAVDRLTHPATVAVIGDGPARARLTGRGLRLLGAHPEAGDLVTAADVLVLPSRSEGFPQAPLHAMAASIPVVATRVGGTPEVVIDGHTGLLVPPECPTSLAHALERLLTDPDLAARLGIAGRQRLLEDGLTRRAMVEKTRLTYEPGPTMSPETTKA